nr:uncharacterized protein LOC101266858 [Solanum lycopersicum]
MDKGKGIQTEPSEEEWVQMQKQRKRLYKLLIPPESPEQEMNEECFEEESYEELLALPPSFEGHLTNTDNKISPEAYLHEEQKMMEVISCALIFEHYRSRGLLGPVKEASSQVGLGDLRKTCECHLREKGHTIEECIGFKMQSAIYSLLIVLLTLGVTTSSLHVMNHDLTYRSQREPNSIIAYLHLSRKQYGKSTRIWFRKASLPITTRMWTCNILFSTKSEIIVPIIITPQTTTFKSVSTSITTSNPSLAWERFKLRPFPVAKMKMTKRRK